MKMRLTKQAGSCTVRSLCGREDFSTLTQSGVCEEAACRSCPARRLRDSYGCALKSSSGVSDGTRTRELLRDSRRPNQLNDGTAKLTILTSLFSCEFHSSA